MTKSLLYTRTGDRGETSLVGGQRVLKNSPRLEAYGTLDEFSSFLGAVCADPHCPRDVKDFCLKVQNRMFDLGGYLATLPEPGATPSANIPDAAMQEMEREIDRLDSETPKIRAFVLPTGTETAARLHIARAVCRRAERRILDLAAQEYVDPALTGYVNRLSDYLFIAARYANYRGNVSETVWQQC